MSEQTNSEGRVFSGVLNTQRVSKRIKQHVLLLSAVIAAFCFGLVLPELAGMPERHEPGPALAAAKVGPSGLKSVRIGGIPHIRQRPDFCGEACAAMVLHKLGHKTLSQDDVFNASKLDPTLGRGCYASELHTALETLGFEVGKKADIWRQVDPARADEQLNKLFAALHADLLAGYPSILCMHYDGRPETTEHFRLIVGYDGEKDEVLYHEPAVADGAYRRMPRKQLLALWPLKYKPDAWTVIRFRLKPGKLTSVTPDSDKPAMRPMLGQEDAPQAAAILAFTPADYAQHIRSLRQRYPMGGMTVILEKPFVVVGNEPAAAVRRRAEQTVRWATRHYKRDYFEQDPDSIITIWLLGDKTSYERMAKAISGRKPTTPFGFYLESKDALIMNIATGGGTLVHEMFHAFVPTNFPAMPPWLNEGMASLYEQCGERNGKIVGFTNWRLDGLKKAIANNAIVPLEKLCGLDAAGFYGRGSGVHYAEARYLCYYLQQNGLLRKYYNAFRANPNEDPTGYRTLLTILDVDDAEAFLKTWQAWVLTLKR